MRAIKFRGKQINGGNWIYGYYFSYKNADDTIDHIVTPGEYSSKPLDFFYVHPETVGQFTCLTDKNGKEIYEGDIIKEKESKYCGEYRLYRVYWCDDNMQYFMADDDCCDSLPLCELEVDYSVIIGNIHDNPELLKS